ncbi:hypothetical protein K432DRAFT_377289 [Lepidopterella palustris CBS 459.81]|uniref:DUF7704 domain-containing protein n=1 Tax=Lepidopterella palustris CBS 459.81 TaxID=1314670 RepID=A0A8E2EL40_9PEZI|nr:hypothetical protein K432DRAFT_377289 [Lepidopterella palustris CBS 459.81]
MALGTLLPYWPAILFAYLEPLSLLLGTQTAWTDPTRFATTQVPDDGTILTPSIACLSYTIGNIFLLLLLVAVLCLFISREARVARFYLLFVALGDLGHIYSSYRAMGPRKFWDFGNYNDIMWGNIGASAFLCVNRVATLMGVFGAVGSVKGGKKVKRV